MDDYLPAGTSITTAPTERPFEDMTRPPVMQAPARDYGVDTSTSTNQQPDVGVWRAGWELDTIPGAMLNRRDAGISFEDDGTDPFAENKGTKFEQMPEYFTDIFNKQALAARREQIEREQELRAAQDRSPWGAAGASLALQVLDPTILIPGGSLVKVGRGVYRFAGSAAKVGAAAAGATAVQEAVLQSQQQLRTAEESAVAIGGSFVLGGMLGGGLSLLTRPEVRKATTALDSILNTRPGPDGAVASGSAVALSDIATKLRAGERVTTEEVQEWAKSARIEARNGRDATPETMARWEEIDRLSSRLEQEASVARASEIEIAARQAFSGDGDRLVRGGGLQVVQSVEDLPARSDGLAHPTDVRGVFDGNKAYIVADNVAPDEVPSVLLHEVGVHFGMERMVGADNFRVLLDDVMARATAGETRFAEAMAAVPKDTPSAHVAEEVLAYLVENAPETGIVQRVIAAVKQFIRQVTGGAYSKLSEAEIRQLAVSSLRKWNPEARPSEIRYARANRSPEVLRTLPDLVTAAREMASWNDWYERYQGDLKRIFGSDAALIQKMLSATSQATSVPGNVTLALKAYRQFLAGEPFEGYLPAVRGNLESIRSNEALRGQKIAEYGKANEGDADGIAVDRHIAELLFDTKSPTAQQVAAAKSVIRQIAGELGWDAKGVQAALWAYNIVRKGGTPQSYDTFLRAKEAEIQALRARYGRGEGEGIPDGGPVGGATGGAGAAAEDAGRVSGIAGEATDVRYSRGSLASVQKTADDLGAKLDISERNGLITLSRIVVPEGRRNAGMGTQIMRSLTDYADANGLRIALTPDASFGGSKGRLEKWYASLGFRANKGKTRDFSTQEAMIREPQAPRYSRSQTETPEFKRWANDAPLVTSEDAQTRQFRTGEKIVVEAFHGTKRPDRIDSKFLKKRATSGPMAYHTSSPELASQYAMQKADTSLAYEDGNYGNWFKFKPPGSRSEVGIDRAWAFLSSEQKQKISDLAPRVMQDDDLNVILGPESHKTGTGGYDQNLAETRTPYDRRGNPLKALVEEWLNSGNLFNDEAKFLDVLEKAGFPTKEVKFDSPNAEFPAVYKNYIAMRNPLVTNDVPAEVVQALEAAAKTDRSKAQRGGADMWDKNTRTLREWVEMFKQADNAYVWTSIPDKVTDVFKRQGYDGIVDWSGKGGGERAPVYIPFEETQVKSAMGNRGTFDPTKNDIRYSRGGSRNERIAAQAETLAKAIQSIDDPAAFSAALAARGGSVGAEIVDKETREDLAIYGKPANAVASVTAFLNPILRTRTSPVAVVNRIGQKLFSDTIYSNMHMQGRTMGPAAEDFIKSQAQAMMGEAAQKYEALYQEGRKAGMRLTKTQFSEAISAAMRRKDEHEVPAVAKAAKMWRDVVFDPLKRMAQETRIKGGYLLDPDIETKFADSYLHRMANHKKLTADEPGFKNAVAGYMEGMMRGQYAKEADEVRARLAAFEQDKADLSLDPDTRIAEMEGLDKAYEDLDLRFSREADMRREISNLNSKAVLARRAGDKGAMKAAYEEIRRVKASGGKEFDDYMRQFYTLNRRRKNVDLGFAGMAERQDELAQKLEDVNDANLRAMDRLVARGQKLERDLAKLDPITRSERIAELREQLTGVLERQDKAAERLFKQVENAEKAKARAALQVLKEKRAGGMKEALAGNTEAKASAEEVAREKALDEQIRKYVAAEQKRSERLTAIRNRIDRLDGLDLDGQAAELRAAVNEITKQQSDLSIGRGERSQRLKDRYAKFDPAQVQKRIAEIDARIRAVEREFYDKWEIKNAGEGVDLHSLVATPKFTEWAKSVADDAFDFYSGRAPEAGTVPDFLAPIKSGPLKERTLPVPDQILEPWLENDIGAIANKYVRSMLGQIEVARKFGSTTLDDEIAEVTDAYRATREMVNAAPDAKAAVEAVGQSPTLKDAFEAWRRGDAEAKVTKERIVTWLEKREQSDKDDIRAGRDLLLGRYAMEENQSDLGKLSRVAIAYNFARYMGGYIIGSLTDIYRPAMVHGLGHYLNHGIKPLLTNLEGVKLAAKEAQKAGIGVERWTHSYVTSAAGIGDPYAQGTALERFMDKVSKTAATWNGMTVFNDFTRSIGGIDAMDKILIAATKKTDTPYLAMLGIDPGMAQRIADQFKLYGRDIRGTLVAETDNWTDKEAVRIFRAAVSKDVNSMFVERSVGDVPLFVNRPLGRMITQFRTFNLASNQRVLMRGLQEDQSRFVGAMVAMTTIGIAVAALRSWRGGEDRWEKFKKSAENPGFLIGEGLDNSGIFALFFEGANTIEKLSQPSGVSFNPIKAPLRMAFPGATQQGESTRFVRRSPLESVLGPSAGIPQQVAQALGGDTKAITSLTPGASHSPFRELIQALSGNSAYGF